MKLKQLLEGIEILNIKNNNPDYQIKGVERDSHLVGEGYLFVAIKGNNLDGHRFIPSSIENGAKAIVVEDKDYLNLEKKGIIVIRVKDSRRALADMAANFYRHPSRKIKVIGITGTNGKTTVSFLLEKILEEAGFKIGVLGTINYRLNGKLYNSINTTPDALTLQRYLSLMHEKNIDYAIMEVSSHALAQERTRGINFSCAIFTNLTSDHLDYHRTKEEYFQAKAKLFTALSPDAYAIINNDDAYAKRLRDFSCAKLVRFGLKDAEIMAKDIFFKEDKTIFYLKKRTGNPALIETDLIGIHNVYNILAAIGCSLSLGLDIETIKKGILKLKSVPGRLELIRESLPYKIFIDYAHTEDALKNVLSSLRRVYTRKKIISVFGCGGDRDKTKRPKMGKITSSLSDYLFVTSDNPRSERPEDIIDDICAGIKKRNFEIIPDRKEAIKKAISLADKDTVVLVAGKGHERYQIIKDKKIPFNDREVVKEALCLLQKRY